MSGDVYQVFVSVYDFNYTTRCETCARSAVMRGEAKLWSRMNKHAFWTRQQSVLNTLKRVLTIKLILMIE